MTPNELVEEIVRAAMSTVFDRHIGLEENVVRSNEPKWDSLHHVELIFSIEDACDVRFDEEELTKLSTLKGIVDAVEHKRAT